MNSLKTAVVIPSWNAKEDLALCLDSLEKQETKVQIIVVDNGSRDGSADMVESIYPQVSLIRHNKNRGFAGGVNAGIKRAIEDGFTYVALLNNDAIADKKWILYLAERLDDNGHLGIVTSKICDSAKTHLDSTGDTYTIWGLPYPRGRGEEFSTKYDTQTDIFAASGGASMYKVEMLKQIGLFDEDFFAYYEDVDISFRAQLAGWKVAYEPRALVYHQIGATSGKIKGFTTYQTMKNLPMLMVKNVPGLLFWKVWIRFVFVYWSFFFSAIARGQGWPALKGFIMSVVYLPKKLWQRHKIQRRRRVNAAYIDSIIVHDLPPNARKLRVLRKKISRGSAL